MTSSRVERVVGPARKWVTFNELTQTYDTRDGTSVAAELLHSIQCLADVFRIAQLREKQRATMTPTARPASP